MPCPRACTHFAQDCFYRLFQFHNARRLQKHDQPELRYSNRIHNWRRRPQRGISPPLRLKPKHDIRTSTNKKTEPRHTSIKPCTQAYRLLPPLAIRNFVLSPHAATTHDRHKSIQFPNHLSTCFILISL